MNNSSKFFRNYECEYFPCHKVEKMRILTVFFVIVLCILNLTVVEIIH